MSNPSVAFVTLGCAKNEVDTDKMKARLRAAGYSVSDDTLNADVVVVNTCSFLVSAVDESLDTIFDIAEQQQLAGKGSKLVVAGCMPARYGIDLEEELPEVDAFVDAADEESIAQAVYELVGAPCHAANLPESAFSSLRYETGTSAYVKVSDGCDRFCSYCMIPHIRGRYRSFEPDAILAEVDELVRRGFEEIVFIGQDTGIWGSDLEGVHTLAALLESAATRYGHTWFRVLYLQPAGVSDELLEVMSEHDNICPYLDIPLQHCNQDVLAAMNRVGSSESYISLVDRVRRAVPGIMVRTTLMAGFPGETQAQFEELLDFIDEAQFDYAVVFPYSQEEGSAAYGFDGQLDEPEKMERAQRLSDACETIGHKRMRKLIGKEVSVLVEGYEETEVGLEAVGRWQGQAPEVDGQVHVLAGDNPLPEVGERVKVKITDTFCFDLEGVVCA